MNAQRLNSLPLRGLSSLLALTLTAGACGEPGDAPSLVDDDGSSGTGGDDGAPQGDDATGTGGDAMPTPDEDTGREPGTDDDAQPDDETGGSSTGGGDEPVEDDGTDTGEPEPEAIVRGRVSMLELDAFNAPFDFDGAAVDIDFRHDDDVIYGNPETPEGTCTVWVHSVDAEEADQGPVALGLGANEGDHTCESAPGGYRCHFGDGYLEPGVIAAEAAYEQMLIGPAAELASETYLNMELDLGGFVNPSNNGTFPVMDHAYTQFAFVHNPDAVGEHLEGYATFSAYYGRNPAPALAGGIGDFDAIDVSKPAGADTPAVDATVSVLGDGMYLHNNPSELLTGGTTERTFTCDDDCGLGAAETRWVYERRVTDTGAAFAPGLMRPVAQYATLECRGVLGDADITIPQEALEAFHEVHLEWPLFYIDARLARVAEVEDGNTTIRAGYGHYAW